MHKTAFIITDVRLGSNSDQPTESQLRKAAGHAILTSWQAQTDPAGTDFESFALGNRQYRFIQGEFRTNSEQFRPLPTKSWPEMSYHIMSEGKEPDLSDEALQAIPLDILENSWNTAHNLVSLGLENPPAHGTGHPNAGLIYPDLLLNSSGILAHCVGYQDRDTFGKKEKDPREGQNCAEKYLPTKSSQMAFYLACEPIRRLEKAQFQVGYLRHLIQYDNHIVLEADWNM